MTSGWNSVDKLAPTHTSPIATEPSKQKARLEAKLSIKTIKVSTTRGLWKSMLRTLLRECSYLPDPNARVYMKKHILDRFKRHRVIRHEEEEKHFQDVQTAIKSLHQANIGQFKYLARVLLMTYGRTGKRRYELLAPLRINDPSYRDIMTRAIESFDMPPELSKEIPRFTGPLEALLKSQRLAKPKLLFAGVNPRAAAPTPTELNAKQRNVALSRAKNELIQWYALTVERLLPPLPTSEWEELAKRASGEIPFKPVVQRARREGGKILSTNLLENLGVMRVWRPKPNKDRPHNLTARFMRRLSERVFTMCPVMEWDMATDKWLVQWGQVKKSKSKDGLRRNIKLSLDFDPGKGSTQELLTDEVELEDV